MNAKLIINPYLCNIHKEISIIEKNKEYYLTTHPFSSITEHVLNPSRCLYDIFNQTFLFVASEDVFHLLRQIRKDPLLIGKLMATDIKLFQKLYRLKIIVSEDEALTWNKINCLEIEINTHCNYRCIYCPVHENPKPKSYMTEEFFKIILDKACEYGISAFAFEHLSEPFLHPKAVDFIKMTAKKGIRSNIFTNAALLSEEIIIRIAELGNIFFTINFPSANETAYQSITGSKLFKRVDKNLRLLYRYKIPTMLVVNSPATNVINDKNQIDEHYAEMFGPCVLWPTDDRAGTLKNYKYFSPQTHHENLTGCSLSIDQLNVTVEGKLFLCCQDVDQRYILGDLIVDSIQSILDNPHTKQIKKYILGIERFPENFICAKCSWTQSKDDRFIFGSESKDDFYFPGKIMDKQITLQIVYDD